MAKALRELISGEGHEKYEVISIDDFMKVSPTEKIYEDDVFEISDDICKQASKLLDDGRGVIIDHVITSKRIFDQLNDNLASYPVFSVHVTCPLDILKSREIARGDRFIGSAEASAEYLFPKDGYDLVVDTGAKSPEENAMHIFNALQ